MPDYTDTNTYQTMQDVLVDIDGLGADQFGDKEFITLVARIIRAKAIGEDIDGSTISAIDNTDINDGDIDDSEFSNISGSNLYDVLTNIDTYFDNYIQTGNIDDTVVQIASDVFENIDGGNPDMSNLQSILDAIDDQFSGVSSSEDLTPLFDVNNDNLDDIINLGTADELLSAANAGQGLYNIVDLINGQYDYSDKAGLWNSNVRKVISAPDGSSLRISTIINEYANIIWNEFTSLSEDSTGSSKNNSEIIFSEELSAGTSATDTPGSFPVYTENDAGATAGDYVTKKKNTYYHNSRNGYIQFQCEVEGDGYIEIAVVTRGGSDVVTRSSSYLSNEGSYSRESVTVSLDDVPTDELYIVQGRLRYNTDQANSTSVNMRMPLARAY